MDSYNIYAAIRSIMAYTPMICCVSTRQFHENNKLAHLFAAQAYYYQSADPRRDIVLPDLPDAQKPALFPLIDHELAVSSFRISHFGPLYNIAAHNSTFYAPLARSIRALIAEHLFDRVRGCDFKYMQTVAAMLVGAISDLEQSNTQVPAAAWRACKYFIAPYCAYRGIDQELPNAHIFSPLVLKLLATIDTKHIPLALRRSPRQLEISIPSAGAAAADNLIKAAVLAFVYEDLREHAVQRASYLGGIVRAQEIQARLRAIWRSDDIQVLVDTISSLDTSFVAFLMTAYLQVALFDFSLRKPDGFFDSFRSAIFYARAFAYDVGDRSVLDAVLCASAGRVGRLGRISIQRPRAAQSGAQNAELFCKPPPLNAVVCGQNLRTDVEHAAEIRNRVLEHLKKYHAAPLLTLGARLSRQHSAAWLRSPALVDHHAGKPDRRRLARFVYELDASALKTLHVSMPPRTETIIVLDDSTSTDPFFDSLFGLALAVSRAVRSVPSFSAGIVSLHHWILRPEEPMHHWRAVVPSGSTPLHATLNRLVAYYRETPIKRRLTIVISDGLPDMDEEAKAKAKRILSFSRLYGFFLDCDPAKKGSDRRAFADALWGSSVVPVSPATLHKELFKCLDALLIR